MKKGVIVRHLLLPGHKKNARDVIRYVYETYGDSVYLSLMNQYTPPAGLKENPDYEGISRKVTKREYDAVTEIISKLNSINVPAASPDLRRNGPYAILYFFHMEIFDFTQLPVSLRQPETTPALKGILMKKFMERSFPVNYQEICF